MTYRPETEINYEKNESTAPAPNTNDSDFEKIANRVSFITIVGNVLLSVIKLLAGIIAHSNAMISDAIHSASDVFSTIIVIIGIKLSARKPDKEHPYGHERMECVAAIVLSIVLFITGLGIGSTAVKNIASGSYNTLQIPGILALAAAILSIVCKEGMYWYTRYNAKNRFQRSHGGRMAPSLRCIFINRSTCRNRRCKTWLPGNGFCCQPCNIRLYCKSSIRYF